MPSSKQWALYSSVHRSGQDKEHRLAGIRIGQVGARLQFTVLHGWKAELHAGRFWIEFHWSPAKDDPRLQSLLATFMREAEQAKAKVIETEVSAPPKPKRTRKKTSPKTQETK